MRKGLLAGLVMLLMLGSSGYTNENPLPLLEPDPKDGAFPIGEQIAPAARMPFQSA